MLNKLKGLFHPEKDTTNLKIQKSNQFQNPDDINTILSKNKAEKKIFVGVMPGVHQELTGKISAALENFFTVSKFEYGMGNVGSTPFKRLFTTGKRFFIFIRQFLKFKPDIVLVNSAFDKKAILRDWLFIQLFGILRILKQSNSQIFLMFHGSQPELAKSKSFPFGGCARNTLRKVNGILVLSEEERRAFVSAIPELHVYRVRNFVELPAFKAHTPKTKPEHILFVGRFIKEKGILDVVNAIPAVVKEKQAHFTLVGDGPLMKKVKALISQLGISEFVSITGWLPQELVDEKFAENDIFIYPTYHPEGMPIVILKALAYGLPIITTPIRANVDILEEGKCCFFVKPQSPQEISQTLIKLLADSVKWKSMQQSCLEKAREFTINNVINDYVKIFSSV